MAAESHAVPSVAARLPYSDALPYYDRDIDTKPGLRAAVQREIENERRRINFDADAVLPPAHEPFAGRDELRSLYEAVQHGQSMNVLDGARHELSEPKKGAKASAAEWQAALDNAETQLAHMDVRLKNVELLRRYGANLWRLHNYEQEAMAELQTRATDELKDETDDLNRARSDAQLRAGDKLTTLESRWGALVSKNLEIHVANLTARADIEALLAQRAQLAAQLQEMDAA